MAEPPDRAERPDAAPLRPGLLVARWLPLGLVAALALLPGVLYLLHLSDPVLAVRAAVALTRWVVLAVAAGAAVLLLGLLAYPPLPARIRLFVDRTRAAWTADQAALQRARAELEHFENAQRHLDVARLAWIRRDFGLLGTHAARAVELDAELPAARYLYGQFLLENARPAEAAAEFEATERLDPGHAFGNALLLQARAEHLAGDLDGALRDFDAHRAHYGDSHRSNWFHGEALLAAGRTDDARRAFADAAAAPPNRLPAEENWYRALARVRSVRLGRPTGGDA